MTWWLRLWRGRRMEAELEKELRFHEDQSVADLVASGVPPNEARRQVVDFLRERLGVRAEADQAT